MERVVFGLAMVGFVAAAFLWPVWHTWRRYGVFPLVFHREAAPWQRVMGLLFGGLLVGMLGSGLGWAWRGNWDTPEEMRLLGWLLLVVGTVFTLLSQRQMGAAWRIGIDNRPTALITHGLYRFSRNPIFTGLLLFLFGVALLVPTSWNLAAVVAAALGIRVQVAYEEQHLLSLHGEAYRRYASRTGRFMPLLGRLRFPVKPGS